MQSTETFAVELLQINVLDVSPKKVPAPSCILFIELIVAYISTRRNDTITCVSKPLKGDWMCNHVIDTCFVSLNVFFHH